MKGHGSEAHFREVDLSNPASTNKVMKEALETFGFFDLVINNAGIAFGKDILDMTEDHFEKTMNVNFMSIMRIIKAVLPGMITKD